MTIQVARYKVVLICPVLESWNSITCRDNKWRRISLEPSFTELTRFKTIHEEHMQEYKTKRQS